MQAVSWYLHYALSYRSIGEMLLERGMKMDHSTINRGVLAYAPPSSTAYASSASRTAGLCAWTEPTSASGTNGGISNRAIDKHGEAVDFLLSRGAAC